MSVVAVVMCGGAGTRLWPLSREHFAKQFIPFVGTKSLLQATLERVAPLASAPIVVCNEQQRFVVAEQLRAIGITPRAILLEPQARGTAPAIAVAALECQRDGPDPVMVVLPSDHHVSDAPALRAALAQAVAAAERGALVTLGVAPTHAATGFGWIEVADADAEGVQPVRRFVEKPDATTAAAFLADGCHLWNSGMFVFRASRILAALERLAPDIVAACRAARDGALRDLDFLRLAAPAFGACRSESIDHAVMEHAGGLEVVRLACGWSDLGTWPAMHAAAPHDAAGNTLIGDVLAQDAQRSYLRSGSRLVAALGVSDLAVVETADAVLVAPLDRAQEVRELVATLRARGRDEATTHRRAHRPWGWYDVLIALPRFKVKHIRVMPGAALSLQSHRRRAEHWVVVTGQATITRNGVDVVLGPDQSTYIPLGTRHRLANHGAEPLEVIEVQTGEYLGEDDIERFADAYGR